MDRVYICPSAILWRGHKKEQVKGIKIMRGLILYLTILVIVNVYIKYEVSILYHYSDIFDEKNGDKEK